MGPVQVAVDELDETASEYLDIGRVDIDAEHYINGKANIVARYLLGNMPGKPLISTNLDGLRIQQNTVWI